MSEAKQRRSEQWETILPGLQQKVSPVTPGPWFQYHDAVGFEWNTFEVQLPHLPQALDGFRIVHLSDLHCKPYWQSAYDDLIDRLNADEPDVIFITGDIVDFIQNPHRCLPTGANFSLNSARCAACSACVAIMMKMSNPLILTPPRCD